MATTPFLSYMLVEHTKCVCTCFSTLCEKRRAIGKEQYYGSTCETLHASERDSERATERTGMRGVSQDGRYMGASTRMSHLRTRRMLRLLEKYTRDQALSRHATPHHTLLRAGRELALVLRGSGNGLISFVRAVIHDAPSPFNICGC